MQNELILTSGEFETVIQPAIGRVMQFARRGGPNALWANPGGHDVGGWNNFGGEKIWLWPQEAWPSIAECDWPPPLDGPAWQAKTGEGWVEWELPLPAHDGGTVRRLATLEGHVLRISSRITNPPPVFPFRLWSVTQIPRPSTLWIPTASPRISPDPGKAFLRQPGGWTLTRAPQEGGKWFFDGDTIIASTPAGELRIQNHGISHPHPHDPVEMIQVYLDKEAAELRPPELPPYTELEFVAQPGSPVLEMTFSLPPSRDGR